MNFGYFKCDNIFYFSCSPLNKCSLAELQADYLAVFIVLILVTSQVGRDKSQLIKKKMNFCVRMAIILARFDTDIFSHYELY